MESIQGSRSDKNGVGPVQTNKEDSSLHFFKSSEFNLLYTNIKNYMN